MTRAGKSYRSATPKTQKESKAEKQKRMENYRLAKAQAKKVGLFPLDPRGFVIPGLIALLAFIFILFKIKYDYRGSKAVNTGLAQDIIFGAAQEAIQGFDTEESREQLTNKILEVLAEQEEEEQGETSFASDKVHEIKI
ncbi:hypothetical protein BGZ58_002581 [Dissophora ornata]|nr:hypothetical protein BGZ58_002581 [Dissophora ornata]